MLGTITPSDEINWGWMLPGLISIPILVLLNGLFVAGEFALVAVRRTRMEELHGRGVKGALAVIHAIDHLDRSIAATQLGITLTSIALGYFGEEALFGFLYRLFRFLPESWASVWAHSAATGLALFLITFMHVVFGELIPKALALETPDRTALWIAKPLLVFARMTRPFIVIMNGTARRLLLWSGHTPSSGEEMAHSLAELSLLIEDTEEAGLLDSEHAEFVQNVFRLSGKRVRDCMVPKEKMATLELNTPSDKILEAVRTGAHTRMPVYNGELNNIVGIVNTKDLFYLFSLKGMVVLEDALYPPLFLKPEETTANALRLFRKTHRPMAIVRDDDDKVHGLITLEDVLEEIVGDIEDEHDLPTPKVKRRVRLLHGKKVGPPGKK